MPLDLFSKTKLPDKIPVDMQESINELRLCASKEECLLRAYNILRTKYRGRRLKTYLRLLEVFSADIGKLWGRDGFLHCTNLNYLLRALLIQSDHFVEDDIKLRWTQIWLVSPHQYVQVNVHNRWVDVDIWGYSHGIEFGDHARGFH